MPASDEIGGGRVLEATHGIHALFQMPVVTFHPIVEVLRRTMLNMGQDCTQGWRIARGFHPTAMGRTIDHYGILVCDESVFC